ncbi:MAG: TOBE-like domain-containing protein [Actinomycetota bacterium]
MTFLGPVTSLSGDLMRPHDLELRAAQGPDTTEATVVRVMRLGFEVRVELVSDGQDLWAQTTRETVDALELQAGSTVHIARATNATRAPEPDAPELPPQIGDTESVPTQTGG